MRIRTFSLTVLGLAMIFASTLFTADAKADKYEYNYYNQHSYNVKPNHPGKRGKKYGHYKNNKWDNHRDDYRRDHRRDYRRTKRYDRHEYHNYRKSSYRKDEPQFIFSLVLPLITSIDSHYDGY